MITILKRIILSISIHFGTLPKLFHTTKDLKILNIIFKKILTKWFNLKLYTLLLSSSYMPATISGLFFTAKSRSVLRALQSSASIIPRMFIEPAFLRDRILLSLWGIPLLIIGVVSSSLASHMLTEAF